MKNVIQKIKEQFELGHSLILAIVVKKEGSAPRDAGAMMLVGASGLIYGTIGGGSVEKNSIDEAMKLLSSHESALIHYDLNMEGNDSIGMICGGSQDIYFMYINSDNNEIKSIIDEAGNIISDNRNGYCVIDYELNRVNICEKIPEGVLNGNLFAVKLCAPRRVIIFGGGHVARALVKVLSGIEFSCVVVENREEFAKGELLEGADKVLHGDYNCIDKYIDINANDFVVIMTHGHVHDYAVLEQVLRKEVAYVGVMGSKKKVAAVNQKLREAGISEDKIASVHTPIGLSIGAVTPAEIAISIAAECIKVRATS